ncbi:MAG: HD domain-containing protein [Parcubacteria group bacterium]
MSKKLSVGFERAVRFLAEHMPASDENSRKPILFHDIRVGVYLYENGYPQDIVLAGVLHDAIEWSDADERMLRDEFGDEVARLVSASTKDESIADKEEKTNELIQRCVRNGQDALIVKVADILDSFKWYAGQNNGDELKNHCVKNADLILKYKPGNFDDRIFAELKIWRDRF